VSAVRGDIRIPGNVNAFALVGSWVLLMMLPPVLNAAFLFISYVRPAVRLRRARIWLLVLNAIAVGCLVLALVFEASVRIAGVYIPIGISTGRDMLTLAAVVGTIGTIIAEERTARG
jgi:hypothetical protein